MIRNFGELKLGEIFAAIVIVGTLIAIVRPALPDSLFGTFLAAREKARVTACASNMKQMGLAFLQYSQDYDEKFPAGTGHWAGDVYPYIKASECYYCPDDPIKGDPNRHQFPVSYAVNANVHLFTALAAPSLTVLMTEYDGTPPLDMTGNEKQSRYTIGTYPNTAWGAIRLGSSTAPNNSPRHDPSTNFLATDGHVVRLRPNAVSSGTDARTGHGHQNASHAAGTVTVGGSGSQYTLTFSER